MADNRATAMRFFQQKGLSRAQAAGVVGSLMQESGLRTGAVNPSSGATGIAQWLGGRKTNLFGQRNPTSLTGQLNFLWSELQGPERAALGRLRGANTIEDAASAFTWGFERPGQSEANMGNRVSQARAAFKLSGGSTVPASMTEDDSPTPDSYRTTTTTTPGTDNRQARAQLIMNFLDRKNADPVQFALQARELRDVAPTSETTRTRIPGAAAASSPSSPSDDGGRVYSAGAPVVGKFTTIGGPGQGTHTLGNWQSDNAIDIAIPVGAPMVALQDGVVVKVRNHPQDGGRFAGDQITIRGANGNEYFYAHGKASVRPGQKIRRGQKLGTTGSANGVAHLHFGQMRGDPRQHTS